mmetsp:Transcript_2122/g.4920  ORF Transcript_2122/g.4920 Transcript_2122/m.4920 type:complete len:186 (+) Transcript_2122:474-1031(+)
MPTFDFKTDRPRDWRLVSGAVAMRGRRAEAGHQNHLAHLILHQPTPFQPSTGHSSSGSRTRLAGGARVLVRSDAGQILSIFMKTGVEAETLVTMAMMLAAQAAAFVRLSDTEAEQEGVAEDMNCEIKESEATNVKTSMAHCLRPESFVWVAGIQFLVEARIAMTARPTNKKAWPRYTTQMVMAEA